MPATPSDTGRQAARNGAPAREVSIAAASSTASLAGRSRVLCGTGTADLFSAMRATLGADRVREHLEAHNRDETVTHHKLRAEQVVDWASRGGARALGMDSLIGSPEPGKADVVLIKNDASPTMFPLLHPSGHVVFQAQRGDVHTVVVNGRVLKYSRVGEPGRGRVSRGRRGTGPRRPGARPAQRLVSAITAGRVVSDAAGSGPA